MRKRERIAIGITMAMMNACLTSSDCNCMDSRQPMDYCQTNEPEMYALYPANLTHENVHGNRLNIHGDEIDDKIYELERWIKLSMIRGKLNELKFGPGGIPGLDVDAAVKEEALIREDGTDAEMDKWLREGELDATDGMKDSFRGALNHFYHWWLELLSADTPGGRREELRSWTGLVEYLRITRNVQLSHGCLRVIQYLRANGLMPNNDPVYLSCYETTARNLREICGE